MEKRLDRKRGAAFGAAALKDETTSVGGHASHKTMDAAALNFFGLISSFWHVCILAEMRGFVTH